jgi:hypothetical protein
MHVYSTCQHLQPITTLKNGDHQITTERDLEAFDSIRPLRVFEYFLNSSMGVTELYRSETIVLIVEIGTAHAGPHGLTAHAGPHGLTAVGRIDIKRDECLKGFETIHCAKVSSLI